MLTDLLRPYLSKKMYAKAYQLGLNLWPCIRNSGGRVTFISEDFRQLKVQLKYNWKTLNLVGTTYGGSLYSSTDPMYMLMLLEVLGNDYVVWDKGCTIRFKRPSKTNLYCEFHISTEMLEDIYNNLEKSDEYTFTWQAKYKDQDGVIYTEFDKVLYVAIKNFYKEKLKAKKQQLSVK